MSGILEFDNGKEKVEHQVFYKSGDTTYLRFYDIALLAGRNVQPVDSIKEYVINETYLRALGFSNPRDVIGKMVGEATIVGVMKDFHSKSLHRKIEPLVFEYEMRNSSCIAIRFDARKVSDIAPIMNKVEDAWKKVYPDQKMTYTFLDESIQKFYENEKRTGTLARTATIIAIVISCLGLFGLSSFTVIQRTKEIGIRKALGASVDSIVVLLSKDFIKLVIIAFVVSAPLAWYAVATWLNDYAYRVDVGWWVFGIAALASVVIAFITISFRTVGAAKTNPVESLRYE